MLLNNIVHQQQFQVQHSFTNVHHGIVSTKADSLAPYIEVCLTVPVAVLPLFRSKNAYYMEHIQTTENPQTT